MILSFLKKLFTRPQPPSAAGDDWPTFDLKDTFIDHHNKLRSDDSISRLLGHQSLFCAAQQHADQMARSSTLTHRECGDGDPWVRAKSSGYDFLYLGENIMWISPVPEPDGTPLSASDIVQIMASDLGHRSNMLGDFYTHFGAGVATGFNKDTWICFVYGVLRKPGETAPEPFNFRGSQTKVSLSAYDTGVESECNVVMSATWSHVARMSKAKPFSAEGLINSHDFPLPEDVLMVRPPLAARETCRECGLPFEENDLRVDGVCKKCYAGDTPPKGNQ